MNSIRGTGFLFLAAALLAAVPGPGTAARPADPAESAPAVLSIEELIGNSLPAVVAVRARGRSGQHAGTGFLVDPTGVIVTNLHLIEAADRIEVRLTSGDSYERVWVQGVDESRDLALLKITGFHLPVLPLGNSNDVVQGEPVIAIGHPIGLDNTVTDGIVSSLRVLDDGVRVIQTTAPVSPGNSGGPLLNQHGEVIGIVTFRMSGENLNFAIPVNDVRGLLDQDARMSLSRFRSSRQAGDADHFELPAGSGVTGRWKSLNTSSIKILRQDGDYLYGEAIAPAGSPTRVTYELTRQPDGTYAGTLRASWSCSYPKSWGGRVSKSCLTEAPIVFTRVTDRRIEGWSEHRDVPAKPSTAFKKYCNSCGGKVKAKRLEFVWIRDGGGRFD